MTRNRSRVSLALLASIIAAVFVATPAHAAWSVATNAGGITYVGDDTDVAAGATVTGYDGSAGTDITIPDTIDILGDTFDVTAVRYDAFIGDGLTSVTIGSNVRTIGDSAFAHNNLTSVDIPASVLWITARHSATTRANAPISGIIEDPFVAPSRGRQ